MEKIFRILLAQWRQNGFPVIHVRQGLTNSDSSLHVNYLGFAFNTYAKPQDDVTMITKLMNTVLPGTDLKEGFDAIGLRTPVIKKFITNYYVSTTAWMVRNNAYYTFLSTDAIATLDKVEMTRKRYDVALIHKTLNASFKDEFANMVVKAELLAMLKPPMTASLAKLFAPMPAAQELLGGVLI